VRRDFLKPHILEIDAQMFSSVIDARMRASNALRNQYRMLWRPTTVRATLRLANITFGLLDEQGNHETDRAVFMDHTVVKHFQAVARFSSSQEVLNTQISRFYPYLTGTEAIPAAPVTIIPGLSEDGQVLIFLRPSMEESGLDLFVPGQLDRPLTAGDVRAVVDETDSDTVESAGLLPRFRIAIGYYGVLREAWPEVGVNTRVHTETVTTGGPGGTLKIGVGWVKSVWRIARGLNALNFTLPRIQSNRPRLRQAAEELAETYAKAYAKGAAGEVLATLDTLNTDDWIGGDVYSAEVKFGHETDFDLTTHWHVVPDFTRRLADSERELLHNPDFSPIA
jgi:hypothetical protein